MNRPSWAPVVLSGALPRDVSDLLAIAILAIVTFQLAFSQAITILAFRGALILVFLVPLISALAALSNSPNREREELALVAYGGSSRQIELRYVLRGCIISTGGLIPLLTVFVTSALTSPWSLLFLAILVFLGGITYSVPALRRIRSLIFVEQYKG